MISAIILIVTAISKFCDKFHDKLLSEMVLSRLIRIPKMICRVNTQEIKIIHNFVENYITIFYGFYIFFDCFFCILCFIIFLKIIKEEFVLWNTNYLYLASLVFLQVNY